ncbi:MAG TPA: RbsD/FucU family protein [Pirellulales bacterium]|nr:RbsD/FucU family protein [Pirellulales bacterium]
MLKHQLLHPQINAVLGRAGHSAKVLIADGNYPASSTLGPRAELVSLNLLPGVVSCTQVLEALATAIPIEAALTMQPETSGAHAMQQDPTIWKEFRNILREQSIAVDLQPLERWEFYRTVQSPEHVLTIQTADQRLFANLLLVVGVRKEFV